LIAIASAIPKARRILLKERRVFGNGSDEECGTVRSTPGPDFDPGSHVLISSNYPVMDVSLVEWKFVASGTSGFVKDLFAIQSTLESCT
jgi:hypothetical protein